MPIANRNNPFKSPHDQEVTVLMRLYNTLPKESQAMHALEGLLWLKVNIEQLKEHFDAFNKTRSREHNENLVAMGDGKGTPFHLEAYSDWPACEKGIQLLIKETENSIIQME